MKPNLFHPHREIIAALSTRPGGVSPPPLGMNLSFGVGDDERNVRKNRELFVGGFGISTAELAFPQQVHGDRILRAARPGVYPNCDALVTDTPRVFLCISHADCVPILLFDPVTGSVAGVHAGWKGTLANIAGSAAQVMADEFGSVSRDILAFLGPAAGACCYAVGRYVASRFDDRFVRSAKSGLYVDLKRANLDQLCNAGVLLPNTEVSPSCTVCRRDLYHSHRRDREKSGRMMAFIGLKSRPR